MKTHFCTWLTPTVKCYLFSLLRKLTYANLCVCLCGFFSLNYEKSITTNTFAAWYSQDKNGLCQKSGEFPWCRHAHHHYAWELHSACTLYTFICKHRRFRATFSVVWFDHFENASTSFSFQRNNIFFLFCFRCAMILNALQNIIIVINFH